MTSHARRKGAPDQGRALTAPPRRRLACAGAGLLIVCILAALIRPGPLATWSPDASARRAQEDLEAPDRSLAERARRAEPWVRRELQLEPGREEGWAWLAFVSLLQRGPGDPTTFEALGRSYAAAPLSPELVAWRAPFVFDQWSSAPPELRRAARAELSGFERLPPFASRLSGALAGVRDPAGRLALTLMGFEAAASIPPSRTP